MEGGGVWFAMYNKEVYSVSIHDPFCYIMICISLSEKPNAFLVDMSAYESYIYIRNDYLN